MSETTLKLKDLPPCPFCGGKDLAVDHALNYLVWVYCRDCATTGPTARNAQQAMKRWSERHSQKDGHSRRDKALVGQWIEAVQR